MQAPELGKSCSHENQPNSKPHDQRCCAPCARGGEHASVLGQQHDTTQEGQGEWIGQLLVRPAQAEQVHRMLAIHIIKEEVPFIKVECPALRKAFAIAGVQLKGEKAFRTTYLNRLFEECSKAVLL